MPGIRQPTLQPWESTTRRGSETAKSLGAAPVGYEVSGPTPSTWSATGSPDLDGSMKSSERSW